MKNDIDPQSNPGSQENERRFDLRDFEPDNRPMWTEPSPAWLDPARTIRPR